MFDEEVASLLEEAGYTYIRSTGRYLATVGATVGEAEHESAFIADELEIPLDDLTRWEAAQPDIA